MEYMEMDHISNVGVLVLFCNSSSIYDVIDYNNCRCCYNIFAQCTNKRKKDKGHYYHNWPHFFVTCDSPDSDRFISRYDHRHAFISNV